MIAEMLFVLSKGSCLGHVDEEMFCLFDLLGSELSGWEICIWRTLVLEAVDKPQTPASYCNKKVKVRVFVLYPLRGYTDRDVALCNSQFRCAD